MKENTVNLYLCGGQEDVLWGFFICSEWVPLTSVDEVKSHSLLLFNERFLLSMRLKEMNTAVNTGNGDDDEDDIKVRSLVPG